MFELMFGGIWTTITAILTFVFYGGFGSGGTITVNGEVVSQAQFNAMLWPKLFFGIFWIIGLAFLIKGLKKLFANMATNFVGKETYGYVVDIINSNGYVNGNPVYNVKIAILQKNRQFEEYIETSGLDYDKYPIGTYVKVKHHKNDINILGDAREYDVPLELKNYVEERYIIERQRENEAKGEDVIYIDGVRYVKAASNKENMLNNDIPYSESLKERERLQKERKNDYFDV